MSSGEVLGLGSRMAFGNVALERRAEHEDVAAQIGGGAGEFGEVVAGPLARRGVGRGEMKALGLGEQPVKTD